MRQIEKTAKIELFALSTFAYNLILYSCFMIFCVYSLPLTIIHLNQSLFSLRKEKNEANLKDNKD